MDLHRSYSECVKYDDWASRLAYLSLHDEIHISPRDISHEFYTSTPWRKFKQDMHRRDWGCDLGILGADFEGRMYLHHINPVKEIDLVTYNLDVLMNPENVITTSGATHNAIHYKKQRIVPYTERQAGDTKLW